MAVGPGEPPQRDVVDAAVRPSQPFEHGGEQSMTRVGHATRYASSAHATRLVTGKICSDGTAATFR